MLTGVSYPCKFMQTLAATIGLQSAMKASVAGCDLLDLSSSLEHATQTFTSYIAVFLLLLVFLHCSFFSRGESDMETKFERLIKQRVDLAKDRSAVTVKLRAERCAVQRNRRSAADEWQVPKHVMASALLIYTECGWAVEPAVKFLVAYGVSKRWRKLKGAVVQEMLESEFLAFEESELLDLRAAHATRHDRSAQRAETYIA